MNVQLLDIIPDPVLVFDTAGHILIINSQVEPMFGHPKSQLIGLPVTILSSDGLQEKIQQLTTQPESDSAKLLFATCRRADGTLFRAAINLRPGQLEGKVVVSATIRLSDPGDKGTPSRESTRHMEAQILKLRKSITKLRELAELDGLTSLNNRRAFQEKLGDEVNRALRYRTPLSLVMMDVDFFKDFNDTYGHPEGDQVLKTIAEVLRHTMRGADFAARYGGEEFAIILPSTDRNAAMTMAERFRSEIEHLAWPHRGVTASLGVATIDVGIKDSWPQPSSEEKSSDKGASLVEAADRALYRSKVSGRNRVTHDDDHRVIDDISNSKQVQHPTDQRKPLWTDLKHAIVANGWLFPPFIDDNTFGLRPKRFSYIVC